MSRVTHVGLAFGPMKIENEFDRGRQDTMRTLRFDIAAVEPGRTLLGLRAADIQSLGLSGRECGWRGQRVYDPVRLYMFDRDLLLEVDEVPDDSPVRIGQTHLEYLQLVVDMANHKIEKSKANGGEWILDMF